ncbi:MAG: MopE-related protein [Myxococcota bacterium]
MKLHTSLIALALLVGCGAADEDFDGITADLDCNDNNNLIFPGSVELCDGIDNDCNGVVDDDYARGGTVFYVDADADGFGATTGTVERCAPPAGYVANANDCDDESATVNPAASETCNLGDDDCNGRIDDNATDAPEWHADWDQDGYGSQTLVVRACEAPEGYLADAQDCNDFDRYTNPLADETCDLLDNNCDGTIDEDTAIDATEWYIDVDVDGYGDIAGPKMACFQPDGYSALSTDCDDTTGAVNPGAEEVCRDGLDNNCNDSADQCSVEGWQTKSDASITWKGRTSSSYMGWDVDFVGDVDGDGYDDFVAGAYYDYLGSDYGQGASYLMWGEEGYEPGGAPRTVTALPSFAGDSRYSYMGRSVAPAGDVDNDGYDDFILGAYGGSSSYAGYAVLVYGGATRIDGGRQTAVDDNPYFEGPSSYAYCGYSVYGGVDLNGDGHSEFALSCGGVSSYRGAVYLYEGSSTRFSGSYDANNTTAAASWVGKQTYDYLGRSEGAISGGDFDGDGNDDLLMGAYYADTSYGPTGAAYLLYGDGNMPTGEGDLNDLVTIEGTASYDYTGHGLGSVGDLNGDGYEDLGVGCYFCNNGGSLYIFMGSSTQMVTTDQESADVTIINSNSSSYLARNSPTGGDFDGDGIDDLAIGSYRDSAGSLLYNGSVWILKGDAALAGEYTAEDVTTRIAGGGQYEYMGTGVSSGDFNGDGYTDLITGAYGASSYAGEVYLFEGTAL